MFQDALSIYVCAFLPWPWYCPMRFSFWFFIWWWNIHHCFKPHYFSRNIVVKVSVCCYPEIWTCLDIYLVLWILICCYQEIWFCPNNYLVLQEKKRENFGPTHTPITLKHRLTTSFWIRNGLIAHWIVRHIFLWRVCLPITELSRQRYIWAYAGIWCKQPQPYTMTGTRLTKRILAINIR